MKILDIALFPVYPPNYGGAFVFYYPPLELVKRKHEVNFITMREDEKADYAEFEENFKNNIYISKKNKFFSLAGKIPYSCKRFAPSQKEKEEIFQNIEKENYDIVMFHGPHSALYFYLLKDYLSSKKIPTVYWSHNIEAEYLLSNCKASTSVGRKIFYYFEYLKMRSFEKSFIQNFNLIFTVSPEDQKKLALMNPKAKIIWIKPIIPLSSLSAKNYEKFPQKDQLKKFDYRILFTGILSHQDNKFAVLWFAKEVMPILRKKINACFVVVGKDPAKEILDLTEDRKNNDIFVFGNVKSLVPFYEIVDLVVVPLFNSAGIKIKLIEALRYKKKIVSRPEGVFGSGLKDIVPVAEKAEDFAQKCFDVLENKIDFEPIWKRFEEMYDNEKIIEELEAELIRLSSSKSNSSTFS